MLGQLLKKARLTAGMTQEQLALKSGVDRSYLSEIERDVRNPTLQMVLRLCKAMNISAVTIVRQLEAKRPS